MERRNATLLLCALIALSTSANPGQAQHSGTRQAIFVSAEQLDAWSILPNPPADQSAEGKAELAEVHRLQDSRQAEQITHAKADDAEEDIFIFRDVLGDNFLGGCFAENGGAVEPPAQR